VEDSLEGFKSQLLTCIHYKCLPQLIWKWWVWCRNYLLGFFGSYCIDDGTESNW